MLASKSNLLLWVAVALVCACANQMQPAKQALDAADSAVATASADASQYEADQFQALKYRLTDLHAAFDKKDYATVLSGAASIAADASALAKDAASKKQAAMSALAAQWDSLSAQVTTRIAAVKARVDALGKTRHPPKGVDLSAAKASLADATSQWGTAQSAQTSGKLADAVKAAQDAGSKLEAAADSLKLKLP